MMQRLTKAVRVAKADSEESDGGGGGGGGGGSGAAGRGGRNKLSVVIERMMLMAAGHVQLPTAEDCSDEEYDDYDGYGHAGDEEEGGEDGLMGMEPDEAYLQVQCVLYV
jgi:hypothetical protein